MIAMRSFIHGHHSREQTTADNEYDQKERRKKNIHSILKIQCHGQGSNENERDGHTNLMCANGIVRMVRMVRYVGDANFD